MTGCIEILQAQVPPEPWVEGDKLKKLLAPIPGAAIYRVVRRIEVKVLITGGTGFLGSHLVRSIS